MPIRKIKADGPLVRSMSISHRGVDEDSRTVELAFSSEEPVDRWFGTEVLDHAPGAIRMDRMSNGGALLMDHNHRDQIGVVEKVNIGPDRVARAVVRFGQSERANEIFRDVVDGIRRHVSVGYRIHKLVMEESTDDGETYRATDWEPYEISLVSVPADATVGVGRTAAGEAFEIEVEEREMPERKNDAPAVDNKPDDKRGVEVDTTAIENQVREQERQRIADITALGGHARQYGGEELAREAIAKGWSVDQVRAKIIDRLPGQEEAGSGEFRGELGMEQREQQSYSLMRAINAAATGNWKGAEFELECSRELAERLGKDPNGFFVPMDVMGRNMQERTMNATTGSDVIATDHMADMFIENLRAASVVMGLGATSLPGLIGNVDIPKKTGSATFSWIGDDDDSSATDPSLGSVAMAPKTVAGATAMSRRLLKQSSPSIEALVQRDLIQGAALAIDLAAMQGSGVSNQPKGIVNVTGVNTQSVSSAGDPTYAETVGFETAVAADDALMGSLAYVTTPTVRGNMKVKAKDSGSGLFVLEGDQANGYRVATSSQLTASRIIFGNWADLLIGMWGVLDIMPDTATKAASGGLVLRVFQDADIAVRHPESFCINSL